MDEQVNVERLRAVIAQAEGLASRRGIDVMDPDAMERWRVVWHGKDGHDMAPVNYNSLRRLCALIDQLAEMSAKAAPLLEAGYAYRTEHESERLKPTLLARKSIDAAAALLAAALALPDQGEG